MPDDSHTRPPSSDPYAHTPESPRAETIVAPESSLRAELEATRRELAAQKALADAAAAELALFHRGALRRYGEHLPDVHEAPRAAVISVVPPALTSSISAIEKTVTEKQTTKVEDRWTKVLQVLAIAAIEAALHYVLTH